MYTRLESKERRIDEWQQRKKISSTRKISNERQGRRTKAQRLQFFYRSMSNSLFFYRNRQFVLLLSRTAHCRRLWHLIAGRICALGFWIKMNITVTENRQHHTTKFECSEVNDSHTQKNERNEQIDDKPKKSMKKTIQTIVC